MKFKINIQQILKFKADSLNGNEIDKHQQNDLNKRDGQTISEI